MHYIFVEDSFCISTLKLHAIQYEWFWQFDIRIPHIISIINYQIYSFSKTHCNSASLSFGSSLDNEHNILSICGPFNMVLTSAKICDSILCVYFSIAESVMSMYRLVNMVTVSVSLWGLKRDNWNIYFIYRFSQLSNCAYNFWFAKSIWINVSKNIVKAFRWFPSTVSVEPFSVLCSYISSWIRARWRLWEIRKSINERRFYQWWKQIEKNVRLLKIQMHLLGNHGIHGHYFLRLFNDVVKSFRWMCFIWCRQTAETGIHRDRQAVKRHIIILIGVYILCISLPFVMDCSDVGLPFSCGVWHQRHHQWFANSFVCFPVNCNSIVVEYIFLMKHMNTFNELIRTKRWTHFFVHRHYAWFNNRIYRTDVDYRSNMCFLTDKEDEKKNRIQKIDCLSAIMVCILYRLYRVPLTCHTIHLNSKSKTTNSK